MEESVLAKIRHIVGGNLGKSLRMTLHSASEGRCSVAMPTDGSALNAVDRVHGGAIASLIDTAATGAAWAYRDLGPEARGTTVSITVNYLAAARGASLRADACVTRRGRSMVFLNVMVEDAEGRSVAQGIVSYKLDQNPR